MKKKGRRPVFLTVAIVFVSISLVTGWTWHSMPSYSFEAGNHIAAKAFYEQRTGMMVEVTGQVVRVLDDDQTDSDFQWFQMRTPNGQHFLVGHGNGNTDSIPLRARESVVVRGEYEWTESGGTIRQTQRDTSLRRRHGWIEYKGKRYD